MMSGIDIGNPLATLQNYDKIDNSPFAGLFTSRYR